MQSAHVLGCLHVRRPECPCCTTSGISHFWHFCSVAVLS